MFWINSSGGVSDDGKYLIVITSETERDNSVFYADLEENGPITGKIPLIPLITKMDADYGVNNKLKFNFHFSYCMQQFQITISPSIYSMWPIPVQS